MKSRTKEDGENRRICRHPEDAEIADDDNKAHGSSSKDLLLHEEALKLHAGASTDYDIV